MGQNPLFRSKLSILGQPPRVPLVVKNKLIVGMYGGDFTVFSLPENTE